jgi:hypothetical protein
MEFMRFDHDEDDESRRLVRNMFSRMKKTDFPFSVVAAEQALG